MSGATFPSLTRRSHMRDLTDHRLMYLKAALLVIAGGGAAVILFLRDPSLTTVVLITVTVWAFARAYYFAFYVIERYIDPAFRFSGLGSLARFVIARGRRASS